MFIAWEASGDSNAATGMELLLDLTQHAVVDLIAGYRNVIVPGETR